MSQPDSIAPPDPPGPTGFHSFISVFLSIMLPMFLAMVDGTIVAAALPAIAGDLGGAERISWIVIAYLIATTIASPVYGRLGDIFGRKRLMYVALAVVVVATILCGLAINIETLTLARVLQGLGGGGLMALSQALIGEAVPPRERARYQGFLSSVAVFATGFGAVAGGFLTQHLGWRSIFFVFAPVGLLAMLLIRRLPATGRKPEPFRFDGVGLFLFVVFITSTLLMLREVQGFSPSVILSSAGLLLVAVVAMVLLLRREQRTPHPLFPLPLFRNPTIWRCDTIALCHGATLVSLITFLPIYLRVGLGADSAQIGLLLLPATIAVPLGSIVTSQLITLTGRTAVFPSFGLAVVVLVFLGVAFWLRDLSPWTLSLVLGFGSLFIGSVMGVVQITVQIAAGPAMLGTAAASVQFSRSTGAALGTALVGALLFATLTATDGEAARMLVLILQQGPDVLNSLPEARRAIVQSEIVGAFRAAFLLMAMFATAAMVLVWTLPVRRL